ncbi:MAG TPA: hypothetical protein VFS75_02670 [Candidatus Paceibacterota bacterium]|nr:hypothetical protein [Candidatus Paceibacterota bacterium]
MAERIYRSVLRISMLVTTAALLFDGGFVFPVTKQLSDNTFLYIAGAETSITATVAPNGINDLTAELTKQKKELDEREAALNARDVAARDFSSKESDYSTYILSAILFILIVLIVLNFAMDWQRARRFTYERQAS